MLPAGARTLHASNHVRVHHIMLHINMQCSMWCNMLHFKVSNIVALACRVHAARRLPVDRALRSRATIRSHLRCNMLHTNMLSSRWCNMWCNMLNFNIATATMPRGCAATQPLGRSNGISLFVVRGSACGSTILPALELC